MRSAATLVQREVAPENFREALGCWATGVALVTATMCERPEGLLVNSLSSVSLEPPLIAFSPSRRSLTWVRMRAAGRFGVNVLGAAAAEYARHAARPGADRFAGLTWELTEHGVPVLPDALAFLQCRVEATHPAGDHWIVVGRVEEVRMSASGDPLVFFAGAFGGVR